MQGMAECGMKKCARFTGRKPKKNSSTTISYLGMGYGVMTVVQSFKKPAENHNLENSCTADQGAVADRFPCGITISRSAIGLGERSPMTKGGLHEHPT